MDPQPATPPPASNPEQRPFGIAGKYTREQWAEMERKAIAAGDVDSAKVFQQMQMAYPAIAPGQKTPQQQQLDRDFSELDDPTSFGNLAGAAFEPNLTLLSGIPATIGAGLAGTVKAGIINPIERATGRQPEPAADLVRQIQEDFTYSPATTGGKNALTGLGLPFNLIHENISDPGGRGVEESFAKIGMPGTGALLGTGVETVGDAVPQLLAGEAGGRLVKNFSPRQALADAAGRVSPKAGERIAREKPTEDLKILDQHGIVPTMGQRWSQSDRSLLPFGLLPYKQLGRWEEAFMRNPFTGAYIRRAREAAVREMNYGQLNDARTPLGLPPIKVGEMSLEDAIEKTEAELSDRYNQLLPTLRGDANMPLDVSPMSEGMRNWSRIEGAEAKFMADKYGWPGAEEHVITPEERAQVRAQLGIAPDAPVIDPNSLPAAAVAPGTQPTFIGQMSDILTTAREGKKGKSDFIRLTRQEDKATLANLIEAIHNRMDPYENMGGRTVRGGTFDGQDLQVIGQWIKAAKAQARAAQKRGDLGGQLLPYIERLQESFKDMVNASNPGSVDALKQHQIAWSQLKLVQDAATARGQGTEYFTPAAGRAAVRRKAMAKPEGQTLLSKGQAQGQELADAAQRVLGNKIHGESPTAEVMTALGELGGDVGATLPGMAAPILANMFGQKVIYSRPFQRWLMQNKLRGRANLPGTPFSMSGTLARGLPTAIGGEERSREYMNDQLAEQLQQFGINPGLTP